MFVGLLAGLGALAAIFGADSRGLDAVDPPEGRESGS